MGAGIGTLARIPTIGTNVPTPEVTRPFRPSPGSNVPQIKSPLVAAGEALVEGADQITKVLAIQQEHKQILDQQQAQQNALAIHQQVAEEASRLPGDQQAQYVQDKLTDAYGDMMQDPGNAHISNYLQNTLPHALNLAVMQARTAGMVQTAKDQDGKDNDLAKTMATQAAGNYNSDFSDGSLATNIRQQRYGMIDRLWQNSPDMAAAKKKDFDQQVTQQRAQFIALDANSGPAALDNYAKSNNLTPEQTAGLRNMHIGAVEGPYHLATAQHEADAQGARDNLDQLAHNHDPGLYAAAQTAVQKSYIDDKQFENYTHSKWRDPFATSAPGLVASIKKDLDANPFAHSPEEIAQYPSDQLSPDDRRILTAKTHEVQAYAKKAVGGEYLRSIDTIKAALTPTIKVSDAWKERLDRATAWMRAAKEEGQFQTVKDVQDFTKRVLDTYSLGKPRQTPQPIKFTPAAPIPPAVAAKVAAEARAANFEPGE